MMKACSIWTIAQDLANGTHPPTLRINEKVFLEILSVDEALDQLVRIQGQKRGK